MKTEVSFTVGKANRLAVKMATEAGTEIQISGNCLESMAIMFAILNEFVDESEAKALLETIADQLKKHQEPEPAEVAK